MAIHDEKAVSKKQEQEDTKSLEKDKEKDKSTPTSKLKFNEDHPKDFVIGSPSIGVCAHSSLRELFTDVRFISEIKPKNCNEIK